jgi:hypothetical protein
MLILSRRFSFEVTLAAWREARHSILWISFAGSATIAIDVPE